MRLVVRREERMEDLRGWCMEQRDDASFSFDSLLTDM